MFDGIQAWLNSPAPIFYFLVFAWILWSSARRLDKRIAKIETDKDKADSDAWWAKWEEGPHEYRQVYSNSVRKEWDRRLGEAKIAKFAHDWGFRALGRDRPYTVPAGKNEAVFVCDSPQSRGPRSRSASSSTLSSRAPRRRRRSRNQSRPTRQRRDCSRRPSRCRAPGWSPD
jgi:hypothetical protein